LWPRLKEVLGADAACAAFENLYDSRRVDQAFHQQKEAMMIELAGEPLDDGALTVA
jgi:hypothetical protein